jgi:hypothetical protein
VSNKAFGFFVTSGNDFGNPSTGHAFSMQFNYKVVSPTNTSTGGGATIQFDYADTPFSMWQKLVAAVQAEESDSTLQVVPLYPGGFESLVFNNTY